MLIYYFFLFLYEYLDLIIIENTFKLFHNKHKCVLVYHYKIINDKHYNHMQKI